MLCYVMSFLKQVITSIFLIMIRIKLIITDRYCANYHVKVLHEQAHTERQCITTLLYTSRIIYIILF